MIQHIRKIYTLIYVFLLNLSGRDITVGKDTIISWKALLVPGAGRITIGTNCYIGDWAVINTYGGDISIGNNVSINYFSILYGHGGLKIGNDCRIAAHTVIVPTEHNYQKKSMLIRKQGNSHRGIHIGNDVWIGANVTVLDGSNISDGCIIGANSTTRGRTDPYSVYAGSPILKIKEREE